MLKNNLLKFLNKKHDWIVNIRVSGEDAFNRAYGWEEKQKHGD